MYNIQIDENKFFTGSYASVGTVPNGVNVETLPPFENQLCYKLVQTEQTKEIDQPILQYIKTVISETEFDVYYFLQVTDDDGNEIQKELTESEYNTLTDDEKLNVTVSKFPKMYTVELTKTEYEALSANEKDNVVGSYKQDSDGNLIYEQVEVKETVNTWEFSQEKYDELKAEAQVKDEELANIKTTGEKIEELQAENATLNEQVSILTDCILEMSEMIYT